MESLQMQDGTGTLHRQDLSMVMPEPSHGFEPMCPVWAHGMWTGMLWPGRANPAVLFRQRLPALWAEPVLTGRHREHWTYNIPPLSQQLSILFKSLGAETFYFILFLIIIIQQWCNTFIKN